MTTFAVGQINTTVGNFDFNARKIVEYSRRASRRDADVICFPELSVCGYPPLDLLDRPAFLEGTIDAVQTIVNNVPEDLYVVLGYVDENRKPTGKNAYNAAAILHDGEILSHYFKTLLPTYEVFNEARYFEPGQGPSSYDFGVNGSITICEDIWNDPEFTYAYDKPQYDRNPLAEAAESNPDVILNLSASPFIRGKDKFRTEMVRELAQKYETGIVLSNTVGANDSLIFDGTSLIVNSDGTVLAQGSSFEEDLLVADLNDDISTTQEFFSKEAGVYLGLREGITNYVQKSGYSEAVLGLSGGIDSTLTVSLAVDAIGPNNVLGILMPSLTSSPESVDHALELADNLGIETITVDISELFQDYLDLFGSAFDGFSGEESGGVENKNQHRIRGNILTTLANKFGYLPLCPGNKTELALGYTTLYGDLTGILAPLADVPKTLVYDLAEWRNEQSAVIPEAIIEKPPSAELALGQRDEDDIGSYETIDRILDDYLENRHSRSDLLEKGYNKDLVDRVLQMIDLSEYKRRQAPTGLKVTSRRNFGGGRQVPEVHHFYEQEYQESSEK
jgi:NAD+ synthetase